MSVPAEILLMARDATRAGFASATGNVHKFEESVGELKKGLLALASLKTAEELIKTADEYNVLNTRIRTVTDATGGFAAQATQLKNLAQQTGTTIESSLGLLESFGHLKEELGLTNNQVMLLIGDVQKLGTIGGNSAEEINAGMKQLFRAFIEGKTSARELRTIFAEFPELAAEIAKGLGTSVQGLNRLIDDAKLKPKDILNAILKQTDDIDAKWKGIPTSITRASTSLSTAFGLWLSDLDHGLGITGQITAAMKYWAEVLHPVYDTSGKIVAHIAELNAEFTQLKALTGDKNNPRSAAFKPEFDRVSDELMKAKNDLADAKRREATSKKDTSGEGIADVVVPKSMKDQVDDIKKKWEEIRRVMQGSMNEAQQEELDQDEKTWHLKMDLRAKHGDLEIAQARGFGTARSAAEADAEREQQDKLHAALLTDRERGFRDELAQLQGFDNYYAQQKFGSDEKLRQGLHEAEIRSILGFNSLKAEIDYNDQQDLRGARMEAMQREHDAVRAVKLGYFDEETQAVAELQRAADEQALSDKLQRMDDENEQIIAQLLGYQSANDRKLREAQDASAAKILTARVGAEGKYNALVTKGLTFQKMAWGDQAVFIGGVLQQISDTAGVHSKKDFERNKAVGIVNAIINTAVGVTQALESSGNVYVGIAMAAVVAALGAAEIAAISATQYSEGGTSSGGGGGGLAGGGSVPAPVLPPAPVFSEQTQNQGVGLGLRLRLEATDGLGRALMDSMRVHIEQNDAVLIPAGSRQAAVIRSGGVAP